MSLCMEVGEFQVVNVSIFLAVINKPIDIVNSTLQDLINDVSNCYPISLNCLVMILCMDWTD